jgi:O-antigen/teichoic acid export membrane protein
MNSLGRKIANGTFWTLVETWGHQIILFVVFVVLARLLGANSIGLAALAMSAPILLGVPVSKGIPDAIIQRAEIDELHLDSAFWLLIGVGVCLAGVTWAGSGLIAVAFGEPQIAALVRFACIVIVIQSVSAVPMAMLKREMNFRPLALRTLIATSIGGIVGIGMALDGYGVWSIVSMQITKASVEAIVLLVAGRWWPRFRFSADRCGDLLGFAAPITGYSLWQYVNEEMPKVILGALLGANAVGIYVVARRPLELLSLAILGPVTGMAMPAVSRLQNDSAKIDRFFDNSIRLSMLVGFPAFMGFAAVAPDIIPLIFGDHWISSIGAVQIILLLGLVRSIDGICAGVVLALGHSGLILKFNVFYTFMAAIIITAAAQASVEATMAAVVFCNLVLVPPFLYYTRELAGIDVLKPLRILPRLLLATLAMFLAVTVWRDMVGGHGSILMLASAIAVGALTYGAAVVALLMPDLLAARELLLRIRS